MPFYPSVKTAPKSILSSYSLDTPKLMQEISVYILDTCPKDSLIDFGIPYESYLKELKDAVISIDRRSAKDPKVNQYDSSWGFCVNQNIEKTRSVMSAHAFKTCLTTAMLWPGIVHGYLGEDECSRCYSYHSYYQTAKDSHLPSDEILELAEASETAKTLAFFDVLTNGVNTNKKIGNSLYRSKDSVDVAFTMGLYILGLGTAAIAEGDISALSKATVMRYLPFRRTIVPFYGTANFLISDIDIAYSWEGTASFLKEEHRKYLVG